MDRKRASMRFTFKDIAIAKGVSLSAVKKASSLGIFNKKDLYSVVEYIMTRRKPNTNAVLS